MPLPCSRIVTAFSVLSLILIVPQHLAGQDAQAVMNAHLKDLTSVSVFIRDIDADAERNGLSRNQLKTDVELRLRRSGIAVEQEAPPNGPRGYLWVGVHALRRTQSDSYIYKLGFWGALLGGLLGTVILEVLRRSVPSLLHKIGLLR